MSTEKEIVCTKLSNMSEDISNLYSKIISLTDEREMMHAYNELHGIKARIDSLIDRLNYEEVK